MKEARQLQKHLRNVPVLEPEFHGAVLALPRLPGIYCCITAAGAGRRRPGSTGSALQRHRLWVLAQPCEEFGFGLTTDREPCCCGGEQRQQWVLPAEGQIPLSPLQDPEQTCAAKRRAFPAVQSRAALHCGAVAGESKQEQTES